MWSGIMPDLATPPLPAIRSATRTGFKDWALVCAALGGGRQSLILRKGGIAEGRDGFRFKHEKFFLFPTRYHQQAAMVRPGELADLPAVPATAADTVEIQYFFTLDFAVWLDDWATVARLEPLHVWKEEVIRARFDYDGQPGLQCAFGRVYRLDPAWSFPDQPAYGGCRSWVTLPPAPGDQRQELVLTDEEHAARAGTVRRLLQIS